MDVRALGGEAPGATVLGWPLLAGDQRLSWLEEYSDHAMIGFEVWG